MPDPIWPGSLPQQPLLGADKEPLDNNVNTPVGQGPPISRPRFSYNGIWAFLPIVQVRVDATQKQALDDFWKVDTKTGSKPFEWKDPDNPATTCRWKFESRPRFRCEIPLTQWLAEFSAVIIPT